MYLFLKRVIDILIAIIALILLSPILIPCSFILLFTGEKEVFYLQKRVGFKNKLFNIWKFATMQKNSPNIGTGDITLRNDPRVTAIGSFLRRSKINELPQIINVLNGTMSIVGPRPLMPVSFKNYSPDIQEKIYNVKPGMTGIGSLIFRDEEALVSAQKGDPLTFYKNYIFPFKAEVEMWYQKNASILTDIKIIFLTAWSIIFPKNKLTNTFFKDLPVRNF
ncbi:MAG: sugar transferase [Ferruginibacter sp.]|nr:sugar transferase [Ferruginibacter sp.]